MSVDQIYCPMIHGGLSINLSNTPDRILINHCCIRDDKIMIDPWENPWQNNKLIPLRNLNNQGIWDRSCWACQQPESAGLTSFRTGSLEKFGIQRNLSGPLRIDLMFDATCNLACRTCGPEVSTYWRKHLTDNKIEFSASTLKSRADDAVQILKKLDLSNLGMIVIAGGETLMGKNYWQVVDTIADMVPDAKEQLTLSFQTNGTQFIEEKYYPIIDKFQLIKLHFSIDAVGKQFEYLRWPASWDQVVDNMLALKENLPVNVMFLIEETISIFNLHYQSKLASWVSSHFATNRLGDITNHQQHLAFGPYGLDSLTQKYVDTLSVEQKKLLSAGWSENPTKIKTMLDEIQKFDKIRGQDFTKIFPEVADLYSDYIR